MSGSLKIALLLDTGTGIRIDSMWRKATDPNPFTLLGEPQAIARAESAWAAAWSYVEKQVPTEHHQRQNTRMMFIVASLALETIDQHDLAHKAIERFLRETIRRQV